jgi:excisionase family DNA binding protein
MGTSHSILNPVNLPETEQQEIRDLYRGIATLNAEAILVSSKGKKHKIPRALYDLMVHVLKELNDGHCIAVIGDQQGLTTVQASKMLGVSRQFLIKELEDGRLPFHMVGTHRRVYLKDLVAYKSRRDHHRSAILDEMIKTELDDYDNVDHAGSR